MRYCSYDLLQNADVTKNITTYHVAFRLSNSNLRTA